MVKFFFATICLPCIFFFSTHAETLNIRVVNKLHEAVDASVVISDSMHHYVSGAYTEKGMCSVELQKNAVYHIELRSSFYNPLDTTVLFLGEAEWQFTLTPKSKELKEVRVTQSKPVFEKTAEGMRIHVAHSILSQSTSSTELMTRIPGVTLSGNKLQVLGVGETMLILDNKETPVEVLRGIPPSQIQSIEVLRNPGARYDAKGKAVIIVYSKKSFRQGISGLFNESVQWNRIVGRKPPGKLYHVGSLTLNARKNKWDISGSLSNEYGTNWMENKFENRFTYPGAIYFNDGYYTEDALSKSIFAYRVGLGYRVTPRSSLSLQYDGLSHFFQLDVQQRGDYYNPSQTVTKIAMQNDATTRIGNHSLNLNYTLEQDSAGNSLFIGAQANQFRNTLLDHIQEQVSAPQEQSKIFHRINDSRNEIWLYTMQIDYRKVKSGFVNESGVKISKAGNAGDIHFFSKGEQENMFEEILGRANGTRYNELIPAVYTSFQCTKKNLSVTLGLRAEYSKVTDYSKVTSKFFIDTSYLHLFPNAKMQYTFSENWTILSSYSKKINRPLYQDLDPFLWYLDSLTSIQGNPFLQPELLHQFETRIMYKQLVLRAGFIQSNNTQWAITQQGYTGPNSSVYSKQNIQHRYTKTIALDFPFEKKNYSSFNTIALNHFQFKDSREAFRALSGSPMFYIYSYHQYKLPYQFSSECTLEYSSGSSDGFTSKKSYYYATIGLSKSLLKNKCTINLLWNDVFRTAQWRGNRTIHTINTTYAQRYSTNYLRFGFTYQFNAQQQFFYKNKSINENEFNRIKK